MQMNDQNLCTILFKNQKPLQPLYVIQGTLESKQLWRLLGYNYGYDVFLLSDSSPYCVLVYDTEVIYSVFTPNPRMGSSQL